MKKLNPVFFIFSFIFVIYLFALYAKCWCVTGDDLWLLGFFKNAFISSDHGNIVQGQLLYTLNLQLPVLFNIHPQTFLKQFNVYFYGLFFALCMFSVCGSFSLFKKNNAEFPLLFIITSIIMFSLGVVFGEGHSYWLKESCTFLRYSFSIIFLSLFYNCLIKNILLNKMNPKNNFFVFLLGLLCANSSEFNAIVCFSQLFFVSVVFSVKYKFYFNKIKERLIYAFSGLSLGFILTLLSAGFGITVVNETNLVSSDINFFEFINLFFAETGIIILLYCFMCVLLLYLIHKKYSRGLFYNTLFLTVSNFAGISIFYFFLYMFSNDPHHHISHGDLKIVLIANLLYFVCFLSGLIVKKITKKTKCLIFFVMVIFVLSGIIYIFDSLKQDIMYVKKTKSKELKYLQTLEKLFYSQYYENKKIIKLPYRREIFKDDYPQFYVEAYMPRFDKTINRDLFDIEWVEE